MVIHFYQSSAERERVDKSSKLKEIAVLSGTLRESTSVLSPTIVIQGDASGMPGARSQASKETPLVDDEENAVVDSDGKRVVATLFEEIRSCNYAYIPAFNRNYFIQDVTSVRNRLWAVSMQVDPLMSFRDEIYSQSLYCIRSGALLGSKADRLPDLEFPLLIGKTVTDVSEYADSTQGDSGFAPESRHGHPIVLTCLTNVYEGSVPSSVGGLPAGSYPNGQNVPSAWQYQSYALSIDAFATLMQYCLNDDTKSTNIISCILYPFDVSEDGGEEQSIIFPGNADTGAKGVPIDPVKSHVRTIASFTVGKPHGDGAFDWMNYSPYTEYELFLPYSGWVNLDASKLFKSGYDTTSPTIKVTYAMNPQSGESTVFVSTYEKMGTSALPIYSSSMLYAGSCQLGVRLSFSTTNQREINEQSASGATQLILTEIGSVLSVAGGVASMNPLLIAGGAAGAVGGVARFANQMSQRHLVSHASLGSGELGNFAPYQPILRISTSQPLITDADALQKYSLEKGFPCEQVITLSDNKGLGFFAFSDVKLPDFPSSYSSEMASIKSSLESGVIL